MDNNNGTEPVLLLPTRTWPIFFGNFGLVYRTQILILQLLFWFFIPFMHIHKVPHARDMKIGYRKNYYCESCPYKKKQTSKACDCNTLNTKQCLLIYTSSRLKLKSVQV